MPIVIHSDQGREFENRIMQELCILCGSHKTRTTPYHPESDGLVERFNRTLLMMLAMFACKNREDWDDLLPAVMMAYRSSVHESTGFSPYRLMFGEECTLPMDIGLPKQQSDLPDSISSPYAVWVRDSLEVAYEQVCRHSGQVVQRQKRLYDLRAVRRLFEVGDWVLLHPGEEVQTRLGMDWALFGGVTHRLGAWNTKRLRFANNHGALSRSQEIPQPQGAVSWLAMKQLPISPSVPIFASTMQRTSQDSPSITVAPPVEGAIITDVDSVHSPVLSVALRVDSSCVLHPFYVHKLDSGPVRLITIAHAFNYRVAVLRDGERSAIRIGRSCKAETCFLTEVNISWGQQVTVMFQIVSTMMVEVPAFAALMRELKGESPNIQLYSEPWGHMEHCDTDCTCLSSDRTASYVHGLLPMPWEDKSTSKNDDRTSVESEDHVVVDNDCGYLGVSRPGSVPFVSHRPGAYGRLLLAVYVR